MNEHLEHTQKLPACGYKLRLSIVSSWCFQLIDFKHITR